mmetsp:Transcript_458/g.670  ORF Transcript_458/g.670 Transcript_458/m.670 type:complete len:243 (-) Transcript_458:268-996(-)
MFLDVCTTTFRSVEGKPIKGGALSLAARFSELTIKIDRPSPLSYDSKAARDRLLKSSISSVIPTARRFKPDNYDPSAKKDPGPMTYNIEAVKDKLAKSPRRVVIPTSRRFKKKKKEETPGPLTYRVNEAKAKLDKKGARAVIPRAKRGSPLRQRSVSPGPGAYKTAKSKDYLGHQGTGATIDRYKAPGHIRNPRTLTPGPSAYETEKSHKSSSKSRKSRVVTFGTARRDAPVIYSVRLNEIV